MEKRIVMTSVMNWDVVQGSLMVVTAMTPNSNAKIICASTTMISVTVSMIAVMDPTKKWKNAKIILVTK